MAGKYDTTSRKAAIEAGAGRYFTGNPCPKGHVSERYTCSGTCVTCGIEASRSRKEYYKDHYWLNREKRMAESRAYYEANRERALEASKAWVEANREKSRAYKRTNKAKRRSTKGDGISGSELLRWQEAQPKICHWCGDKCDDQFHVDHYMPLSKGGKHEVSNLVISCPPCNLRKSAKHPAEFAASIGRLL